ncbi:uncharacterized protein F4822DRAFT_434986 [Hypoxylon trugodes]|uniref:uncharacterized protein n=1 Tax=Hypoxylon trugodes TaxID=326681 RepID=UPI00219926F0|nr:uncharacterized protein F4822DRAFT_434986 [Hypoxylon trugodes]KAI1383060.1 hypothetical protein F4822DRAFT_434986 [Hypoxylon trugodes]
MHLNPVKPEKRDVDYQRALAKHLINEFVKVYPDKASAVHQHLEIVKVILEDIVKASGVQANPVLTRVKELSSALDSLQRRQVARFERQELIKRMCRRGGNWEQYCKSRGEERMIDNWGPFENVQDMIGVLHDFGGARVCTCTPKGVRRVVSFLQQCQHVRVLNIAYKANGNSDLADLRSHVEILELGPSSSGPNRTEHKMESLSEKKRPIGYRATHVVVEMLGDVIPKWHRDSHYRIEIQVMTIWMHWWSQAEHGIVYKPHCHQASDQVKEVLNSWNGKVTALEDGLDRLSEGSTDPIISSAVINLILDLTFISRP